MDTMQARKRKLSKLHRDIWLLHHGALEQERLRQEQDIAQHLLRWKLETPFDVSADASKPAWHELDADGIAEFAVIIAERKDMETSTENAIAAVVRQPNQLPVRCRGSAHVPSSADH